MLLDVNFETWQVSDVPKIHKKNTHFKLLLKKFSKFN